jgi:tight adherence protein B
MASLSELFGNLFLGFMVFAFVAVVLLIEGLYLTWNTYRSPEAKKVTHRLQTLAAGARAEQETVVLKQRLLSELPFLQRLLFTLPRLREFDRLLEQSGLQVTVSRLLLIALLLGGAAFAGASYFHLPTLVALVLAAAAASLPFLYVLRRRTTRIRSIERQLPDALDLISRALRAGHAFPSGLQMVGEEMTDPIAGEFRITHDEVNYGISLKQALLNMGARVPSTDMRYFIIAVLIQRDTGGNLTEVLQNLSTLIRERFKLLEKVRVLAAEGKLSAWIVGLLPFFLAGVVNVINPGFMQVLWTDPVGLKMVGVMLSLMFLGIIWMRQIIRIHV